MKLLEVIGLSYSTPQGVPLQTGIDFSVRAGEMFVIRGPNGAGKTTLLNILRKEGLPYRGEIRWSISSDEIVYLPQLENTLIHWPVTLREVLRMAIPQVSDETILNTELLEAKHLGMLWNSASGGERKRTLLAKALLTPAKLLILDEPLNHLDTFSRDVLMRSFEKLIRETKKAILLVSHAPFSNSFPGLELKGGEG